MKAKQQASHQRQHAIPPNAVSLTPSRSQYNANLTADRSNAIDDHFATTNTPMTAQVAERGASLKQRLQKNDLQEYQQEMAIESLRIMYA